MTLSQVIQMVDSLKENAFSMEVKTQWINEIEGMVQTQVMMVLPTDIITYTWETDQDKELLVNAPHSQIYWLYLSAMIDFGNGEYDLYANTMQMFNAKWQDFQAWFLRMYHPADDHEDAYQNETPETIGVYWRGYFLTAYGLAVKHGFQGDESQWLESLIGVGGREVQMQYDDERKWIQWRLMGEETWQDLLDIGLLQQGVINQTLSDAQASKLAAQQAAQEADRSMEAAKSAESSARQLATAAEQAQQGAQQAAQKAEVAKVCATEAEAQARLSAETAAQKAEQAAQSAAQSGYMNFDIDDSGNLIFSRTENVTVDFKLEEGDLILYG